MNYYGIKYYTILLFLSVFVKTNAQTTIWNQNLNTLQTGSSFTKLETDTSGFVYNIAQNRIWKQTQQNGTLQYNMVATYNDSIISVADAIVEPNGSIFLTGYYKHPGQGTNIVTVKYDSFGNVIWAVNYNGSLNNADVSTALILDNAGNVLITGYTNDNAAGTATTVDAITIKYAPNGAQLWATSFNGMLSKKDKANDIITDNSNNVYIVGSTEDYYSVDTTLATTIPFPNPGTPMVYPSRKMFLIKYSSAGTFQWIQKNATSIQGNWYNGFPWNPSYFNYDEAYLIEFASNTLYVAYDKRISTTNIINRSWSLNDPTSTSNLRVEPFLARYDVSGNLLANVTLNSSSPSMWLRKRIKKVQADFNGNIYVKRLNNVIVNSNEYNISKYTPTITQLFSKPFSLREGSVNFELNQNHLFIASFRLINNAGIAMDSLTKYDLAGTKLWTSGFNTFYEIDDVTIDTYGDPYVLQHYNYSPTACRTSKFCNNVPTVNLGPDISICPGDTVSINPIVTNYAFPGTTFKWNTSNGLSDSTIISPLFFPQTTTIYTFKTTLLDGCSATDQIKIKVPVLIQSPIICNGESFIVNGHSYTTSGDYIDTLLSVGGLCDSLIYTHLTVKNNYSISTTSTICLGDSILLAGAYRTQSGVYVDSLQSAFGCDSIVTTNLTVKPSYNTFSSSEICQGDSTLFMGTYYYTSGTYTHTLQTVNGCDSSFTLQLLVHPSYSATTNLTICGGDSVLIFGQYQHLSGIYIDSLQTIHGCDSVQLIHLNFNPSYIQNEYLEICTGDSVLLAGFYQTQSGVYTDSLQSINGCDSTITTILTAHTSYNDFFSLEICQGDSAQFLGSYHHTSGIYNQLFQTVFGCDSSVTYQLIVHPVYTTTNNLYICSGDSILVFGNYQSQADTYIDSLHSINGCDSIQIIQLHVNTSYHQQLSLEICEGDSALLFNQYQTIAGIYRDSLQTIEGCDSITEINLIVLPTFNNQFELFICQGDSIPIFGQYQSVAGIFADYSSTINGCDSTTLVTLHVSPNAINQLPIIHLCDGDSSLIFGNYEYTDGVYYDTLQTVNGCDSILVQELDVTTFDNVTATFSNGAITASPSGLSYSWLNCITGLTIPGQINPVFVPASGGTYAAIGQLNGCLDTSDCYTVTYVEIEESHLFHVNLFPNPATSKLTIDLGRTTRNIEVVVSSINGEVVIETSFNDLQSIDLDIAHLAGGNYFVSVLSEQGISRHELIILP